VAEGLGPLISARQGHAVALFGYEPAQLEDDQTFIPGARIFLQALGRAVEIAATVQGKVRSLEGLRPEPPEVPVSSPVRLFEHLQEPVRRYRTQIEAAIRSARTAAINA